MLVRFGTRVRVSHNNCRSVRCSVPAPITKTVTRLALPSTMPITTPSSETMSGVRPLPHHADVASRLPFVGLADDAEDAGGDADGDTDGDTGGNTGAAAATAQTPQRGIEVLRPDAETSLGGFGARRPLVSPAVAPWRSSVFPPYSPPSPTAPLQARVTDC
jgi:hypothetical protein